MASAISLKGKLQGGASCIGPWILTSSSDVTEILALSGMDFVLIDHEHGQGNISDAVAQMRSIKGSDCAGIVRVPHNDHIYIKRVLDAGAGGIMVPNVNSADDAQRVVEACRYAPDGVRGAFSGMRAMSYGFRQEYHTQAFAELLVVVQVESPAAIESIPEIAEVDGVDVIFIGPRDLSANLGKLNQFDDPLVQFHIREAEQKILSSGKILGSVAPTGRIAKEMSSRGYRFIVSGSDAALLGQGARATLLEAR